MGSTDPDNGLGHCRRFNLAKEIPGWESMTEPAVEARPSRLTINTPTGHIYQSTAPALLRHLEGPEGERAELLSEEPLDSATPPGDADGDGPPQSRAG